MQTEAIDALFLELSQFTKAQTRREHELQSAVEAAYSATTGCGDLKPKDRLAWVAQILQPHTIKGAK